MAETVSQNFENHVVFPKKIFIAFLLSLAGIISAVVGLLMVTTTAGLCLIGTGTLLVGMGTLWTGFVARGYVIKVQDRVIRLEMRLRLEKILPPEMQGDILKLTIPRLVGLRFASDAEMPALVRKVLAEDIQDPKPIKQMVTDWQADHARA